MNHIPSPRNDDDGIEAQLRARGLTAPRITPEALDANIKHVEFVVHTSITGQVLRWAVLTARNGFAVTGRPSASVSPENDNREIGEAIALKNAKEELWPLMGYQLKSELEALRASQADVQAHQANVASACSEDTRL